MYSERPIILYTEGLIHKNKWIELRNTHSNIIYLRAKFLDPDHLNSINIRGALKILILSSLK